MARIRTIKPDFWTDEKLTDCSMSARLLFIGTWNFADDYGNLDRSAKQIKARVFPLDPIDCEPLLQELIAQGVLTEYSSEGKTYLHIMGFVKHQVINRPSQPLCPLYEDSVNTHGALTTEGRKEGRKGIPENFSISERVLRWAKEKGHSHLEDHLENFISSCKKHGYKYVDWDEAFMEAIRKNWAGVQKNKGGVSL